MSPADHQGKLTRSQPLSQELPLYLHLHWYLSYSLVRMKFKLVLCKTPYGEPARDEVGSV